jgi:hypothetical protein
MSKTFLSGAKHNVIFLAGLQQGWQGMENASSQNFASTSRLFKLKNAFGIISIAMNSISIDSTDFESIPLQWNSFYCNGMDSKSVESMKMEFIAMEMIPNAFFNLNNRLVEAKF